jgi:threonine dehydratase
VVKTPIIESEKLNRKFDCRFFIKAESLQRTGSFKIRGACNMIANLKKSEKEKGIVAFSSGNHAQGVAAAARIFKIKATIVMPSDAPQNKLRNTKEDGATVILYDRSLGNRVKIAQRIVDETGAILIPPYDARDIISGQGTLGMEFVEQIRLLGLTDLDYLLAPCSGGGMIAGCAIAFRSLSPSTLVYAVEPESFNDTALSLEAGRRIQIKMQKTSFCDALLLETPGENTFKINKELLSGGLTVTDAETAIAMKTAFHELKIIVEPSGAVALAAALTEKLPFQKKNVGIICSGGNVDFDIFTEMVSKAY